MSNNIKIGIIVPVHNAPEAVEQLINSLSETILIPYSLIFIDDNSFPEVSLYLKEQIVKHHNLDWQYLHNNNQQLFTRTVNRGIRAMEPSIPYICEINTDVILHPGWLELMLEIMEKDETIGICGYDGAEDNILEIFSPNYVSGHCIMLRRKSLESVGVLMETDMGGVGSLASECPLGQAHIASDRILCWRLVDAGWKMIRISNTLVEHGFGPSWNRDFSYLNRVDISKLWVGKDTI